MKFDLLRLIGKHSKLTLAIIMVITAFFLYHAAFLHLNADYNSLMTELQGQTTYVVESGVKAQGKNAASSVSDQIPETGKLETGSLGNHLVASTEPTAPPASDEPSYTTTYLVMIESPALYTAEHLSLIEAKIHALEETEYLSKSYSVLDFVTLEKRGTRLATMPFSSHQENQNSWTDEEAQLLKSRIASDPLVRNYLVSEDLQGFLFSFESTALTEAQEQELADMLGTLTEAGMKISINGGAVITNRLMHYLGRDLSILLSLCFVAILLVYYLSFKAKRSVLLPFSMSVIGIIWTFGTMRLLGYSLTIVNIVTPCMVLNLGSSYAIHVIGEYYTDYSKGMNSIESTKKILRTIFFACVTTVIGFMSLLFSKTQALREFGVAVGFGVTYCAVLASTYLPAQLSLVVPPKKEQIRTYRKGYLARAVLLFDRTVAKKWPLFVLLWVLVIAGYALTRDHIPVNTNYMSYLPKRDPFGKSSQHFAQQMGGDIPYVLTIEAPEGEEKFFLKSENLGSVYSFEQALSTQSEDIRQILS
ncbi:MAG: RND transporter, partial [Spirochaetia bacterium]|nr:RND transporter [Spirochaetia bacterium]